MTIQYIMNCKCYCIDETMIIATKKVNKHIICQCYYVPLILLIYPISLPAEFLFHIPNHHKVVQECQNRTTDVPCLPYL